MANRYSQCLTLLLACSAACGSDQAPVATPLAGASAVAAAGASGGAAGASTPVSAGSGAGPSSAGVGGARASGVAGAGAAPTGAAGAAGAIETPSGGAGGGGASGVPATGAAGAPATGEPADPRAACVSGLKTMCPMRELEACSTVVTVDIGDLIKAVEIPLGPYGAIMEQNVGQGFEVPVNDGEASCDSIAASFGEPADVTANVADLRDVDLALYTVYRPACMREGETYPVITWGNGTCGQTEGYGPLLRYVASYGYVVFSANSRYTGGNGAMTKALDFAEAANADANSVYFNRLDLAKIGAMGHSQGGGATITAASDPRIKSLIIWNGGTDAEKPFLAVSGDTDIGSPTAQSLGDAVQASSQPSAWLFYHQVPQTGSVSGHLTLMNEPQRVVEVTVKWWDYQLKVDATARDYFVGASCGLCVANDGYEYGANGLQ